MTAFIIYLICGTLIGFLAGLLGIGGSVIGIPTLLLLFHHQGLPQDTAMHIAMGTVITTVVVTSSASIYAHYRNGMILFPLFRKLAIGAMLGSLIGVTLAIHMQGVYLQKLFGALMIFVAFRMLREDNKRDQRPLPTNGKIMLTSLGVGTLSGLLGISGSIFIVMYLNRYGVPLRNAIATAATCILPITAVAAINYLSADVKLANTPALTSGFVHWPAFIGICATSVLFARLGANLTCSMSTTLLRKIFAGFLIIAGCVMLFD